MIRVLRQYLCDLGILWSDRWHDDFEPQLMHRYTADDIVYRIEERFQVVWDQCNLGVNVDIGVEPDDLLTSLSLQQWRDRVEPKVGPALKVCRDRRNYDVLLPLGFVWNSRGPSGDYRELEHQTLLYFNLRPGLETQSFWDPNGGCMYLVRSVASGGGRRMDVTAVNRYNLMAQSSACLLPVNTIKKQKEPKNGVDIQGILESKNNKRFPNDAFLGDANGYCTMLVNLITERVHNVWISTRRRVCARPFFVLLL